MFRPAASGLILAVALMRCTSMETSAPPAAPTPTPTGTRTLPLTDMGSTKYLGFEGGLYPGASNTMPTDHWTAGLVRAAAIEPLDADGQPSVVGKYVLLSIGMSNTTQEFCSRTSDLPCDSWTFMGQAAEDASVEKDRLALVNGAMGGKSAAFWDSPTDPDYDRIRDTRLRSRGLGEPQVQVVWLKVANPGPRASLPSAQADAYMLLAQMGSIARALKVRYPNLRQVFVSSRIYAGYATSGLNPEPYAFESGLAVKWLITAQIEQMRSGQVDPRAGDLNYGGPAPWIAWGPYLWADGLNPRSDGLVWQAPDFESDGTHPARSGETKVATMLLAFFKQSPHTRCWFLRGLSCP